jgi:hypothetical protein
MRNVFTAARKKKGWTLTKASNHMSGISEQQLRNLEGISATRDTLPENIKVKTALEIIRVYWPDLDLADFILDTDLAAKPASPAANRRLKGYAG